MSDIKSRMTDCLFILFSLIMVQSVLNLFIAQRFDRIELRGLVGGIEPEERADAGRREEGQQDGCRDDDRAHVAQLAEQKGAANADCDADQAADDAEQQGLGQELHADVVRRGANRLADADLARPLGDADQHDVHDADAADDQRDACHPGQQRAEGGRGGFACADDVLLGGDGEVQRVESDIMPLGKQELDLLGDVVHVRAIRPLPHRSCGRCRP